MAFINTLKTFFTGKNFMRSLLAMVVIIPGITYIFLVTFKRVPPENRDIANLCAGFIFGLIGMVAQYYFGTSQGSQEKDETIKGVVNPPNSVTKETKLVETQTEAVSTVDK